MQKKRMKVPGGVLNYAEAGTGTPVVFLQGIWVSSGLWDDVINCLDGRARIFQVEWPLGGHSESFEKHADLSPHGVAALVLEFIERLDLRNVVLCTNDTGGAIAQLVVTADHPVVDRIAGLLLSNVDSYEHFPPPPMYFIRRLCRFVPPLANFVIKRVAGGPAGNQRYFSATCSKPVPQERQEELFANFNARYRSRADFVRFYAAVDSETTTVAAARRFADFKHPVTVVWGLDDMGFPVSHGERLVGDFPNASLVPVEGAHTFVPLDAPETLTEALVGLIEQAGLTADASS